MASQCSKFQVSSFSRSRDILRGNKNFNGSRDHKHTHPFQGRFVVSVLGPVTILQCMKFEIFTFTHYEDMKSDKKCTNWGSFGLGVTEGHRQHTHSIEHI